MIVEKFWKWMFKLSKKKFKEKHLDRHHNDIKCPNCNEWFSLSGVSHKHKSLWVKEFDVWDCTCGQCNHTSYWSPDLAPFLVLVDSVGNPIK